MDIVVYNFGIFDMPNIKARGNIYYGFWSRMIERCYSEKSLLRYPQYLTVSIYQDWQYFSNFYNWATTHYIENYELDKDIIQIGSRIYSPDTCCFVPQEINKSIIETVKGNFPCGVWYKQRSARMTNERSKPYIAECCGIILGQFESAFEAHQAWQLAKINHINNLIDKYFGLIDIRAINGFKSRILLLQNHYDNNLLTLSINSE